MAAGITSTLWKLETAEETSVSVMAHGLSRGTLYFIHTKTREKFAVNYKALGLSAGIGPPLVVPNPSQAKTSDPSWSIGNVGSYTGKKYFNRYAFPCVGAIFGANAGVGILGSILKMELTTGGVELFAFGWPLNTFAYVKVAGLGRSGLPAAGLGAQACYFWLKT